MASVSPALPPHPHGWDCLVLILAAAPEPEKGRERVTSWAISPPAPSARGEASQVDVISAHQGLGGKAARTPALPPNALLILTWELVSDTCWSLRGISASATHPHALQPHKFRVDRKRERMAEPDGGVGGSLPGCVPLSCPECCRLLLEWWYEGSLRCSEGTGVE